MFQNNRFKMIAAAVAMTAVLAFSGCSSKTAAGKEPAAHSIVEAVAAEVPFVDTMSFVDDQFPNFYRIEEDKVVDKSMYVGTLASAEEITVIRLKDAADIEMAKTAIAERLEDQKIAFENYQPGEMEKIEGAKIYTHGAYVMLVVADDTSKAESAFNAQF